MKILFDVTSLLPQKISWEGLYAKSLFRALKGLGVDIEPIYKAPRGFKDNFIEKHIGHSPKKFYAMFAPKGAVLHGPNVDLLSESAKLIKVISVNDLSMFREDMMDSSLANQLQNHLKQQLQLDPQAIFVPSHEVHNEFLVRYPKYVSRVHVIHPGCDHIVDSSNIGDNRISQNPYFAFVGLIDKRSNVAGLIQAFEMFCKLQENVNLVLAGDAGFGSEAILKLIDQSEHRDRIQLVGHKSISQLKKIYASALALVAPSFYEGFHYPMFEAMKMGCPVITSGLSSMEELGREAAHLVNPKDPEQIMAAMERVMVDINYQKKMVESGRNLTEKMTWLKCARSVADIYEQVSG